jgi:DNA-binding transcriptional ArsR family regulator
VDVHRLACHVAEVSNFLRLFSGETRLRILVHMFDQERTAGEFKADLGISQPVVARYLSEFRYAGVVDTFKKGRTTYYQIVDERVYDQVRLLHKIFCSTQ